MTVELKYLTLVTVFTALMWIPYILNMITVRGLIDAVGSPDIPKPLASWATLVPANAPGIKWRANNRCRCSQWKYQ